MSHTHLFLGLTMKSATGKGNSLMEASSRDGYAMVEQRHRRPSVKPVNVAGCREWSTSSKRRFRRSAPREFDDARTDSANEDCFYRGYARREERPSAESIRSQKATDAAAAPASVTTRITRRFKEMKQVSFLNCVSLTLSPAAKEQDATTTKSQHKHGHSKFRQRKKSTMSNGSDNLDGEPSLRIPALFPEPTETRKKLILRDSLTKLKNTMFKSRSTTPTNFDDVPDRCMNRTTSPSVYTSGARRCRRQENLVKMMEKKLEERGDERTDDMSSPPPDADVFSNIMSCPPPADSKKGRQNRNRKIKTRRHRTRKIVHRRTVTC